MSTRALEEFQSDQALCEFRTDADRLSLAPGFSPVWQWLGGHSGFNRFSGGSPLFSVEWKETKDAFSGPQRGQ